MFRRISRHNSTTKFDYLVEYGAMKRAVALLGGVSMLLVGCGGSETGGSTAAPTPTPTAPITTPPVGNAGCTAGNWSIPSTGLHPAVQLQTDHFAIRYNNAAITSTQAAETAAFLEKVFAFYLTIDMPEPFCASSIKSKINVDIDGNVTTESAGADTQGLPLISLNPASITDRQLLAHELTHVFQQFSGHLAATPYTFWFWESHANWMSSQVPELRNNTNCGRTLVDFSHLYLGSARTRYCNWQFLEYLKDRYGYSAVQDIWKKAPKVGEAGQSTADPFSVLMSTMGWSVSQLNDQIGTWATRNITWDYTNPDGTDQGAIYRSAFGAYANSYVPGGAPRRLTELMPIDMANRRFASPASWAPQRFGYNVIRLVSDRGASSITVAFRGVAQASPATQGFPGLSNEPATVPAPASGWRWSLVVVDGDGKPRYGDLMRGGDEESTIALRPGDQAIYMVVVGAPTELQKIVFNQPYYSVYRFPYMIQLTNALPWEFRSGGASPLQAAHQHPNGGGWVADAANVASTAYVGPYAKVLGGTISGNARVEDNAIMYGGTLSGSAILAGLTMIDNSNVTDTARIQTWYDVIGANGAVALSGAAQLRGDFAQYDAGFTGAQPFTASRGIFFGATQSNDANVAGKGANLTAAPGEVTAIPGYIWR